MSTPATRTGARRLEVGLLGLLLLFAAARAVLLPSLQHLIDEGTNVYSARLIQQGRVPFRDFPYHQPPLFVYLLALLPTDHFVWGRALSLLATCGTGAVLFLSARALLPAGSVGALAAPVLFLGSGLQVHGLMALPNASMLLFATLGCHLVLHARRPCVPAGAAAIVIAVLFKPIVIPVIFAVLLALAVEPARRRDALRFALVVGAGAVLSFAFLHVLTDGAFTDLVRLQSLRYAEQGVLGQLKRLPQLREDLAGYTSLTLNLAYHRASFSGGELLLVLIAVTGPIVIWSGRTRFGRADVVLWCSWPVLCAASLLFVWDVSWPHYHVLYLPPLAMLGAAAVAGLAGRGRLGAIAALLLCVVLVLHGQTALGLRHRDYGPVTTLRGETAPLLAFDPTVNVLSRTASPCGLVNHLAQLSPVFRGGDFARFHVDPVRCLAKTPEAKVVIHQLSDVGLLFVDRALYDAIRTLPPERVVFLGDDAREAFDALPALLGDGP